MRQFREPFRPLSESQRRQSLLRALAGRQGGARNLIVFGYASLMWSPDISHYKAVPVRLHHWRREMVVWTTLARGSLENPGLALGLMPGGYCDGVAYFVPAKAVMPALKRLWAREMWTDIYRPAWVPLKIAGRRRVALTFTVNQNSLQFAGDVADDTVVRSIASAAGERGTCADYLASTVRHLQQLGIRETKLVSLLRAVQCVAADPTAKP